MAIREAVESVTTKEPDRWNEILEEIGFYDYYHLSQFHRLAEIRGYGEAVMPVFHENGYIMAFPLMLRDIQMPSLVRADKGYKDASSAPGLIGPLVSAPTVPEDVRLGLMRQFQEYLMENRIITVYSRLNFFFNQIKFLRGYGEIRDISQEVSIDLTKPPEKQFSDYEKGHREDIRKLKRLGFTATEVGPEFLDRFLEIYYDTMDKVNAQQAYYYDRSYFEYLLNEMGDVMHLFACKDGDIIACIGIICICNGIIHTLYAGTAPEYRRFSPSKLRIDSIREWGNQINAHTLHLGSGSKHPGDTLYKFKMGFGGREHTYSTWRYVADQEAYDCRCREARKHADTELDDSYFPVYRDPRLQVNNLTDNLL